MIECALCGFTNEVEIVSHIRADHGGIQAYLAIFPDLPVVSANLFVSIENAIYFGYIDTDEEGLATITTEEKEILIVSAQNNAALRSEISVEPNF